MRAVILSRKDFGEYDQIISVYTEEMGRLEVFAKGVKKILSKNSFHLEPFALSELEILRGKDKRKLIRAYGHNFFTGIRKDFKKSFLALDAVNFLRKITREEQRDIRLFALLESYFNFLNDFSSEISFAPRYSFYLKSLAICGFAVRSQIDDFSEEKTFCFSPREGGFLEKTSAKNGDVFCSGKEATDLLTLCSSDWARLANLPDSERVKEMSKIFIQYHLEITI